MIKEFDQLCRGFLWGDVDGKRKFHALSWECMYAEVIRWYWLQSLVDFYGPLKSSKILFGLNGFIVSTLSTGIFGPSNYMDMLVGIGENWLSFALLYLSPYCRSALSMAATVCSNHMSCRHVWCPMALPQHRFIFWLAIKQKLLTKDVVSQFISGLDVNCPVCSMEPESQFHIRF